MTPDSTTTPRPRLGQDFNRLFGASTVSNLGDGVLLAAGPLLVASLTREPAAVAAAVFAQQLPWLLFALVSGAVVDRLDRRRLVAPFWCAFVAMAAFTALAWRQLGQVAHKVDAGFPERE